MVFHGCCCSVLLGLNKVVLARDLCYDVIQTMLFVIMAASFLLLSVQISLFWLSLFVL